MKLLSKFCSILGAMTLATSAYSASQPLGAGGVEVIRANAGKGTNLNMFSGTIHTAIASNLHIQAPTITGTGTVSMTLYTHDIDITGGSFAGFLPGDDIATLGGAQFTIQKVVSASKVQTRQINVGATFSTASWVRYPAMAYIYDVNGNQVGFISNGGAIGIIGNTGGGNIGEFALLNQFGTNGWDLHLQDTVGDFVIVNNRSVTPNAQGPVLRFSSFATEDAFIIDATSMAIFGFGVSNNGTMWAPNLASNVTAVNHLAQGANGQVIKIPVASGGSAFPLTANADAARFRITNLQAVVLGPDAAYTDTNIWVKAEATNGQNSQLQFLSYAGGDKSLTELAFWQVHLNSTNGYTNAVSIASQGGVNTGSSITEILTDSMYRFELIQGANNQKKFTIEVDSTPFFAWMTNRLVLTNDSVGIGTLQPAANLDVPGSANIGTLTATNIIPIGTNVDYIIEGDSHSVSNYVSQLNWTDWFRTNSARWGWVERTNAAVAATFSTNMLATYTNQLQPWILDGNGRKKVLLLGPIGVNDIGSGSFTPSQTWVNISNLVNLARQDGALVMGSTIPDSVATPVRGPLRALNSFIIANRKHFDYLADIASTFANRGALTNSPAPTTDGIHGTSLQGRMNAEAVAFAIQTGLLAPRPFTAGFEQFDVVELNGASATDEHYGKAYQLRLSGATSLPSLMFKDTTFGDATYLDLNLGAFKITFRDNQSALVASNIAVYFTNGAVVFPSSFVGIGSGTPSSKLDVVGRISASVGTGTNKVRIGGTLTDFIADASNVTTTETDLYSFMVQTNTLELDKDKITFEAAGSFTGGTPTKQLKVYLSGTAVFDSGALGISSAADWHLRGFLIRSNATVVRSSVTLNTSFASLSAYSQQTDVSGLTLTTTNIFLITGTSAGVGAASADIVANQGTIDWKPAGPQ